MHAEVDQYRTHHWQVSVFALSLTALVGCHQSQPCQLVRLIQCPKCGNLVKRAMNRPPQEADCRGGQGKGPDCRDTKCAFHMHQRFCGGDYTKVLHHCALTKLSLFLHLVKGLVNEAVVCGTSLMSIRSSVREVVAKRHGTHFSNAVTENVNMLLGYSFEGHASRRTKQCISRLCLLHC